jgi:hypothetical protein
LRLKSFSANNSRQAVIDSCGNHLIIKIDSDRLVFTAAPASKWPFALTRVETHHIGFCRGKILAKQATYRISRSAAPFD